jgi:uncharacterized protein (DUF302 family)
MITTGAVSKQSRYSFADTVAKLSHAITAAGNTIFATIDQSAAATSAGLTLRPTTLIVFGNPAAGTHLMDAFPLVALELPLKLLVWQDGNTVTVAYIPMSGFAARYGVTGVEDRISAIDRALDKLTGLVRDEGRP